MNEPSSRRVSDQRVLLISMPWARAERPSLGLGTLKTILAREGITADVGYLNCLLARQLGLRPYTFFAFFGYGSFRSEVFFTPHYFDLDLGRFVEERLLPHLAESYAKLEELGPQLRMFPSREMFLQFCAKVARHDVGAFLDAATKSVDWDAYDIVGFSLMFEQTLPSLCLAKWIKRHHPDKTIVFGGPSCEGEMGEEILRSFACVDVVSLGESDLTIAPLVRALRGGRPLAEVPGIAFREDGAVRTTGNPPLLTDLDWLPVPDYSEFWRAIDGIEGLRPKVFFETSRGCWWGQKSLCTFCGLNANGLAFRRKSAPRALAEILELEERNGVHHFSATDNILDYTYYKDFLPRLLEVNEQRDQDRRLSLFYQIKSEVRKDHVALLARSGVDTIQPGIESFSEGILTRMRKGSTVIQQVQLLRWAAELGLSVYYGLIHSNPLDEPADYQETIELLDSIDHLAPPSYVTPLILDRFSPYFNSPAEFGIRDMRPGRAYAVLFPDERIDRRRIAYSFDYDHDLKHDADLQAAIAAFCARVLRWQKEFRPRTLTYTHEGDGVRIIDRRRGEPVVVDLAAEEAEVFEACDGYLSRKAIASRLPGLDGAWIDRFLDDMISRRLMLHDRRGHFLSLPVASPPPAVEAMHPMPRDHAAPTVSPPAGG